MKQAIKFIFLTTLFLLFIPTKILADSYDVQSTSNQITVIKTDNNKTSYTTLDISEATFYDDQGNVLEKPNLSNFSTNVESIENGQEISIYKPVITFRDITGGTWTNGSGYRVVKGLKVSHYSDAWVSFKADLQLIQKGQDRLDRIYNINIETHSGVTLTSIIKQGVFNSVEGNIPAYGGVQYITSNSSGGNSSTHSVYLKVANDTYYISTKE